MRVAGLPSDGAPAGDGIALPEIRPFGQVGLGDDHGAGLTEPGDERRVSAGDVALERQASCSGRKSALGLDIVLHHDRHSVERPPNRASVERAGFVERARLHRDDRIHLRLDPLDPIKRDLRALGCASRLRKRSSFKRERSLAAFVSGPGSGGAAGKESRSGEQNRADHLLAFHQRGASRASREEGPVPTFSRAG